MTLILETPESDIHRCPGCGANCAVDRTVVARAADAGQQVRIACHKCAEVFRPRNDNPNSPSRQSAPASNPRVGLCTSAAEIAPRSRRDRAEIAQVCIPRLGEADAGDAAEARRQCAFTVYFERESLPPWRDVICRF